VIIDYVMNHSAAQNPLFLNSKSATSNAYRDWYVWSATKPTGWSIYGNDPWYYGGTGYYFAGFWDQMPEFNLRNADALAYHQNNLRYWLNRGADGFRFDAVGNLVENGANAWEGQPDDYTIMSNVRGLLDGYAQRYMVCEGPVNPIGFSVACCSAFAFGHDYDIVNAAKGSSSAIQAVASYFSSAAPGMATMVSNHDSFAGDRLYDQVGGDLAQYQLAAATYLLQPGTPFIYYGEEIGMAGGMGLSGDWKLRTPMSWTNSTSDAGFTTGTPFRALSSNVASYYVAAEQSDSTSLLGFYKALIAGAQGPAVTRAGRLRRSAGHGQRDEFPARARQRALARADQLRDERGHAEPREPAGQGRLHAGLPDLGQRHRRGRQRTSEHAGAGADGARLRLPELSPPVRCARSERSARISSPCVARNRRRPTC